MESIKDNDSDSSSSIVKQEEKWEWQPEIADESSSSCRLLNASGKRKRSACPVFGSKDNRSADDLFFDGKEREEQGQEEEEEEEEEEGVPAEKMGSRKDDRPKTSVPRSKPKGSLQPAKKKVKAAPPREITNRFQLVPREVIELVAEHVTHDNPLFGRYYFYKALSMRDDQKGTYGFKRMCIKESLAVAKKCRLATTHQLSLLDAGSTIEKKKETDICKRVDDWLMRNHTSLDGYLLCRFCGEKYMAYSHKYDSDKWKPLAKEVYTLYHVAHSKCWFKQLCTLPGYTILTFGQMAAAYILNGISPDAKRTNADRELEEHIEFLSKMSGTVVAGQLTDRVLFMRESELERARKIIARAGAYFSKFVVPSVKKVQKKAIGWAKDEPELIAIMIWATRAYNAEISTKNIEYNLATPEAREKAAEMMFLRSTRSLEHKEFFIDAPEEVRAYYRNLKIETLSRYAHTLFVYEGLQNAIRDASKTRFIDELASRIHQSMLEKKLEKAPGISPSIATNYAESLLTHLSNTSDKRACVIAGNPNYEYAHDSVYDRVQMMCMDVFVNEHNLDGTRVQSADPPSGVGAPCEPASSTVEPEGDGISD